MGISLQLPAVSGKKKKALGGNVTFSLTVLASGSLEVIPAELPDNPLVLYCPITLPDNLPEARLLVLALPGWEHLAWRNPHISRSTQSEKGWCKRLAHFDLSYIL